MATTTKDHTARPEIKHERKKTVSLTLSEDDVSEASTEVSHVDFSDEFFTQGSCNVHGPRTRNLSQQLSDDVSILEEDTQAESSNDSDDCDCRETQRRRSRTVSFLLPEEACTKHETIISIPELYVHQDPSHTDGKPGTCVVPVHKVNPEGGMDIVLETSVITKKDGSRIVITDKGSQRLPPPKKVKKRDMAFLKAFSIVSLIICPPLGLVGLIFLFKTLKSFKQGLIDGDMDRTYVLKKRTESLVVASFICGLIMWGMLIVLLQNLNNVTVDEVIEKSKQ